MEVIQTSADGLKREFKIVVDATDIESRIEDRLEEIRKSANIPGFRPGKAPVSLLRTRYGENLRGEVLEQAVTQTSSQALAEQNLRPAMQPRIEIVKFDAGDDLEYTMAVELLPEIVFGDFADIKLTRRYVDVGDADVMDTIERLAENRKNYAPVAKPRKAKKGDALIIDFEGHVDGEAIEGGSATGHRLELGANAFVEGFEDPLIGARPGDHVSVNLTFPEKYVNDDLAGKDAVFEVDVKEIQEAQAVTVDDAFATGHGFENLDAMRDSVRDHMNNDYTGVSRSQLKRALLDALAAGYDFAVPEGMVDTEFDAIWQRLNEDRERDEVDPSDVGRGDDELRPEYRRIAERRVRLGLLLSEIGRSNNVTVGNDEVQRAVMERARAFPGQEERLVSYYRENPQALAELRAPLFEDKVIDLILEQADVADKAVSVEELMRDSSDERPDAAPKKAAKPAKKAAKPAKPAKKTAMPAKKPAVKRRATAKKTTAKKKSA